MSNNSFMSHCCWIFCCPPFLSSIVKKLSFFPPDPPSYSIVKMSNKTLTFRYVAPPRLSRMLEPSKYVFPYLLLSEKNNELACLHIVGSQTPLYTILFSHGNACDFGEFFLIYLELSIILNCNFVLYDYSGYGASTGKPSEEELLNNIEQIYDFVSKSLKIPNEKIILMGHSIGSVPSIHLASKIPVAGVILQAPLASGLRFLYPNFSRTLAEIIKQVNSPVLIIHGLEDKIISSDHGYLLYKNAPNKVEPLWLSDIDHNNIEQAPQYLATLRRFIDIDLKKKIPDVP